MLNSGFHWGGGGVVGMDGVSMHEWKGTAMSIHEKQEQNARSLPHDSPSLTEPEPTVLTSLAGQHAPGIHLSPPFNAVDMSSHAWLFTKVQRI